VSTPQQPELARAGLGEVVPDAAKVRRGGPHDEAGRTGAVPEENRPGHHPEHEQDKPHLAGEAKEGDGGEAAVQAGAGRAQAGEDA
jgi:hypothetical protein